MKLYRWLLLFFVAVVPVHASTPPFPDWVVQAANPILLPVESKNAKAAVLLEDTLLSVDASGQTTIRVRRVIKILRPQGRDYAVPIAWFRSDRKLLSFHVWSIGPDGHQ
jgi:hypothetical protein